VAGYGAGANVAPWRPGRGSFFLIGAQNISTRPRAGPPAAHARYGCWLGIGGRIGGIGPLIAGALAAGRQREPFYCRRVSYTRGGRTALALHLAVRRAAGDGLRRPD
jgi:hypothetical protein